MLGHQVYTVILLLRVRLVEAVVDIPPGVGDTTPVVEGSEQFEEAINRTIARAVLESAAPPMTSPLLAETIEVSIDFPADS